jgi:hypothetical protein
LWANYIGFGKIDGLSLWILLELKQSQLLIVAKESDQIPIQIRKDNHNFNATERGDL